MRKDRENGLEEAKTPDETARKGYLEILHPWVVEPRVAFVKSEHSFGWLELMNCVQMGSNILFPGSGLLLEKTFEIHF